MTVLVISTTTNEPRRPFTEAERLEGERIARRLVELAIEHIALRSPQSPYIH